MKSCVQKKVFITFFTVLNAGLLTVSVTFEGFRPALHITTDGWLRSRVMNSGMLR